ncbi:ataxia telangiectasia mutated [Phaffia rhodozyma]|uniref:Serine/threonine-protein kinase Tel1 n=1 Tax=Phaffia rhodozyma TaxID=264483 RepID=A0A0F7SQV2_PHARH|nr:ataxia telangiectasia mutated [Phaffia rhodozyma]
MSLEFETKLENVLSDLRSEKIKTREQGVSSLRELLLDARQRYDLLEAGQGQQAIFSSLFKAIFFCVGEEKKACVKKGAVESAPPVSLRRLTDIAFLLRQLVQFSSPHLAKKTVRSVYTHLIVLLEHQGTLFSPVALDYIKALQLLFIHKHHIEAFEPTEWEALMKFCFAALFDEELELSKGSSQSFSEAEGRGQVLFSYAQAGRGTAEERYTVGGDDSDFSSEEDRSISASGRKRKRHQSQGSASRTVSYTPSLTFGNTQYRAQSVSLTNTRSLASTPIIKRTTTLEKIALASLIHTLLVPAHSLPLLGSSLKPRYDQDDRPLPAETSFVASGVLYGLLQYLLTYTSETSAHLDILRSVNIVFSVIQLNQLCNMKLFTVRAFPILLKLWANTRSKELREQILISWKWMFPFISKIQDKYGKDLAWEDYRSELEERISEREILEALLGALENEVKNRWGNELLMLDNLKLEFVKEESRRSAFVAGSFSYGHNFSSVQAMTWATLELQADTISAIRDSTNGPSLSAILSPSVSVQVKRQKIEKDPFSSLLEAIRDAALPSVRIFHLQVLLFFIDRHEKETMQEQDGILKTLILVLGAEDTGVQSWAFVCLASVASVAKSVGLQEDVLSSTPTSRIYGAKSPLQDSLTQSQGNLDLAQAWEQVWKYATRRINIPLLCRAAGHVAYSIVRHRQIPNSALLENVGTFLKDIELQGPFFPYDTVCQFISSCLDLACEDLYLFRLEYEERVLNWLVSVWNVVDGTTKGFNINTKLENHSPNDLLDLLSSLCRFKTRVKVLQNGVLPDSDIVNHLVEENRTKTIREYVIHARLPLPLSDSIQQGSSDNSDANSSSIVSERDLIGRPRKVSSFLLKSIDSFHLEWKDIDLKTGVTPEKVRRSLDLIVLSLCFENLLQMNGITSNRRAVKRSCLLLTLVAPALSTPQSCFRDSLIMIQGLEPLLMDSIDLDEPKVMLLKPGPMTGIRKDLLAIEREEGGPSEEAKKRAQLHCLIWRSSGLQDTFATQVLGALNSCLHISLSLSVDASGAADIDTITGISTALDEDGFGTINTSQDGILTSDISQTSSFSPTRVCRSLIKTTFTCMTRISILQSGSLEPSRQRDIFDLLENCDGPQFIAFGDVVFEAVKLGRLHLGATLAEDLLNSFEYFLRSYAYSKDIPMLLLTISFIESTLPLWIGGSTVETSLGEKVRMLRDFFVAEVEEGRLHAGPVRARLIAFLEAYCQADPQGRAWSLPLPNQKHSLPLLNVMKKFAKDVDIHVRSQAAVSLANLFSFTAPVVQDSFKFYSLFYQEFSVSGHEQSITLTLFLANITIASTTVRRASYFHLLELPSMIADASVTHVETSLKSVATVLGLSSLFKLWEVYAPVVLTHIMKLEAEDGEVPSLMSSLLGYASARQNSEMILRRFGSVYLAKARIDVFSTLCRSAGRKPDDAISSYLPQMIAGLVSNAVGHGQINPSVETITESVKNVGVTIDLLSLVSTRMDTILVSVFLRLFDPSTILEALPRSTDGDQRSKAYARLSQPVPELYNVDSVLFPRSSAVAVICAHDWFVSHQGSNTMPLESVAFNVLHELVSEVGKTPLVVEQIRCIYSIALFVSIYHHSFRRSALLVALLRLSVTLMSQAELVPLVQGFVSWGLDQSFHLQAGSSDLAETFVRVAHLSNNLTSGSSDGTIAAIGETLLTKLGAVLFRLSETDGFQSTVQKVLCLWPRPLTGDLATIHTEMDASDVLIDRHLLTAKFTLAKEFHHQLPLMSPADRASFTASTFWHILSSMNAPSISQESRTSFVEILHLLDGQLKPPSISAIASLPSTNPLHNLTVDLRRSQGVYDSTKCALVVGLVALLKEDDLAVIDLAYRALRITIGLSSQLFSTIKWGSDISLVTKDLIDLIGTSSSNRVRPKTRSLQDILKDDSVDGAKDYDEWIKNLTSSLAGFLASQDMFFIELETVLSISSRFSKRVLPLLVQAILAFRTEKDSTCAYKDVLSCYFETILQSYSISYRVKQAVIDVVLHLRHIRPPGAESPLAYNHWLDLDCLLLSKAAVQCRAFTTALLFIELRNDLDPGDHSNETNDVLYKIYSNIEDPDGFYGIQSSDIRSSLVQRFHHESQWTKAFQFHGADLQASSMNENARGLEGTLQALNFFGFDKMAMCLLRGSQAEKGNLPDVPDDLEYELAWRNGNWDIPVNVSSARNVPGSSVYAALKAVHQVRDPVAVSRIVDSALCKEIAQMCNLSIESMTDLRSAKISLLCLREIRTWLAEERARLSSEDSTHRASPLFASVEKGFEFSDIEKITAVRSSLLDSIPAEQPLGVILESDLINTLRVNTQLQLSDKARSSGQLQISVNAITTAQRLSHGLPVAAEVSREFAHVLWLQGEHALAIGLLRKLISLNDSTPSSEVDSLVSDNSSRAELLSLLGEWLSTARLDTPEAIQSRFFQPAIELLQGLNTSSDQARIFHRYAVFAEDQYRTLQHSPEIERLLLYRDRQDREIEDLRTQHSRSARSQDDARYYNKVVKKRESDVKKIEEHNKLQKTFLRNALVMFAKALAGTDEFDDSLIRLVSLWMGYFADDDLNKAISSPLVAIPSYKFLPLINQLSARLDRVVEEDPSSFQKSLHSILIKLCYDHPFHCLYQLITHRDSSSVPEERKSSKRKGRSSLTSSKSTATPPRTGRALAADYILHKYAKKDELSSDRLRDVSRFCSVAIEWSCFNTDHQKPIPPSTSTFPVDQSCAISKIRDLHIPVPTIDLPLDFTCKYSTFIHISSFGSTWKNLGGIHRPKCTTCIGSDGARYRVLFKHDDDLRQDAIMEQLFDLINTLLRRDRETRSRSLSMRTYKVVVLAQTSGFIEFVEDTSTLGSWLIASHKRYNPTEPGNKEMRVRVDELQKTYLDRSILAKEYLKTMDNFHPVLRHFFTEKQKEPLAWFAMRLDYTRSVAVGSMIGHIVGLGDRHLSNIMLVEKTGELVHIDLGIAFDQGRELPIPELVPFRLTNDVIDGFGMSGIEGVFRRCSEETLRVLREQAVTLMTVLEVFRFDPLQSWVADARKIARVQGEKENRPLANPANEIRSSTDEDADRALQGVRGKLDRSLSVEYTVNQLIQTARDPANLASIFTGWSSWM